MNNSTKTNKLIGTAGLVISKIIEIGFWIAAVGMAVCFILALVNPGMFGKPGFVVTDGPNTDFNLMGISLGWIDYHDMAKAFLCASPFAAVTAALYAMIFRNINLVLKQLRASEGESFGSENSPFRPDIVRMVREIGIFAISIPVISLVGQIIARIFFPEAYAEVDLMSIAFGVAILYLSSIFSYGEKLQDEMNEVI